MRPTEDIESASEGEAPATVETAMGRATFRRTGDGAMELDVEYHAEGGAVELPGGDLQAGVAALCEKEIGEMRRTLGELGEELAGQLSDDGRDAVIRRDWNDRWSRSWRDDRTAFRIEGAATRMRENLAGYEGVSEVRLVRGTVALMIEQRERNIREMYAAILSDARAGRHNAAAPIHDAPTAPVH